MDALALLCNLHGDGPATLTALRLAGCGDLEGLAHVSLPRLAEALGADEDRAARFRREGLLLRDRIEGGPETERAPGEIAPPAAPVASGPASEPTPAAAAPRPTAADGAPDEPLTELVPCGSPRPLVAAPEQPEGGGAPVTGPVVEAVLGLWGRMGSRPAASRSAPDQSLVEADLVGLTPADAAALEAVGITTVVDLAEAEPLALGRTAGIGYTHLAHLAYLARRALAGGATAKAAPVAPPVVSPVPSSVAAGPRVQLREAGGETGAGGPFA